MKYQKMLCLFCALLLTLALCACNSDPAQPSESSAPPVTEVPTQRMTDATPTDPPFPDDFEVWRSLDEIKVYPFAEQELLDAETEAERIVREMFSGEEVLEFALTNIAFDPALTDVGIRRLLSAEHSLAKEEDYYKNRITFAARYYVVYDHEKSAQQDETSGVMQFTLSRAGTLEPWTLVEGSQGGTNGGEYSARAMGTTELSGHSDNGISGRMIAGYSRPGGGFDLYTVEENGEVRYNPNVMPTAFPSIEELHPQGVALDADALTALQVLLNPNDMYAKRTETDWYAQCLTSEFASPADVDLRMLFYNGIIDKKNEMNQLSEEERAHLASVWGENALSHDVDRMPVKEMNRILQKFLGTTLDKTKKNRMESMTYWAATDCYYRWHGDTNAISPLVYAAYTQEDGTIAMYYVYSGSRNNDGVVSGLAMLKPAGEGYQILSNEYFD